MIFGALYTTPPTIAAAADARPRRATTFNFGYDRAEGERYPWVGELSLMPGAIVVSRDGD